MFHWRDKPIFRSIITSKSKSGEMKLEFQEFGDAEAEGKGKGEIVDIDNNGDKGHGEIFT